LSVLYTMIVLGLATFIDLRGRSVVGGLLAAYGIFELTLRIDLWSLAVWVM
jgi:hypothetical protein